jgi:hypothetical protein
VRDEEHCGERDRGEPDGQDEDGVERVGQFGG